MAKPISLTVVDDLPSDMEGSAESDGIPSSNGSESNHDHDITPRASGQAMAAAQAVPPRIASLPSETHAA